MSRNLAVGLVVIGVGALAAAQELEIGRTAVLGATLPVSSTWQVEQQQVGGAWAGTGVLVAGRGMAVSVRMDGWDGAKAYRFQRVAGGVASLTPTVAAGWHLAGSPGAGVSQWAVERSGNLTGWEHEALLFPSLDGRVVRALREPLGTRGFFRAEVPGLPAGDASVTGHTPAANYEGAAGFGAVYDDMPQIFKDGFIGALNPTEYHRGGANAAAAGECYELAGPYGRTTVMITDLTEAPPGTVDAGRSFFDLGLIPFAILSGGEPPGGLTAGVRLVPAPVTGNVKFQVIAGSNIYYMPLRFYNYRAGVTKVEVKNDGSTTWVEVPRTTFNAFVYQAGGSVPPMDFPVQVRVTSRFGEVVNFPSIDGLVDGQRVTGLAQFAVFPELAPMPEHRVRPAYVDRFTNVPGDMWSAGGYGGATLTEVDTSVAYQGTASLRMSGLGNFAGVTFSQYPGFTRPENGVMRFAVPAGSSVAADQVLLAVNGEAAGGGATSSATVQLPALGTGWQVFEIPLEASGTPPVVWGISLASRGAVLPEVWLDGVEFLTR